MRLLTLTLAAATAAATPMSAQANIVPVGQVFRCTPTAVWDGDGPIWCAEGPKIRLAGMAAREIDGSCRPRQPCPSRSGVDARNALVRLLGSARGYLPEGHVRVTGLALSCVSTGAAKGDRTGAWCRRPDGSDLSCLMIATGTALRWERYDPDNRCNVASKPWQR